jgi:hypothetical protein
MDLEPDEYIFKSEQESCEPKQNAHLKTSDGFSCHERSEIFTRRVAEIEKKFPFLSIRRGNESHSKPHDK